MSLIGAGTYSRIYDCYEGASKVIDMENFESFVREVLIVRSLLHKNIIVFDSAEFNDGSMSVFMKKFDMDLERYIFENKPICYDLSLKLAHEIVQGLAHMHAWQIIHADLKPRNILLSGDSAVIIDFGLSEVENNGPHTSLVQTVTYRAPEIDTSEKYNYYDSKIDIFSFGCILYEIIAGIPLFEPEEGVVKYAERAFHEKSHEQIYDVIYASARECGDVSTDLLDIAAHCLAWHPKDRPSARELLAQFNTLTNNITHIEVPELQLPDSYVSFMKKLDMITLPSNKIEERANIYIGAVLYSQVETVDYIESRDDFEDTCKAVKDILWEFNCDLLKLSHESTIVCDSSCRNPSQSSPNPGQSSPNPGQSSPKMVCAPPLKTARVPPSKTSRVPPPKMVCAPPLKTSRVPPSKTARVPSPNPSQSSPEMARVPSPE